MMDEKMTILKNGIDEKIEDFLQNSEELKRFIAFRKNNFYDYSIRNTILIYKQNPNATLVAGIRKWNELGYRVKKGSRAISILVPLVRRVIKDERESEEVYGYRPVNVFDKSQVEATEKAVEIPSIDVEMKTSDKFEYTPMKLYRAVKKCIEQYAPIELKKTFFDEGIAGQTDGKTIYIKKSSNRIDMSATMIHEFIHYNCHFDEKEKLSKSKAEIEAELGALIFGTHFNLDVSGIYKYLSSYRRGVDIEKSFEKVLGIMEKIIYGNEEKRGIQEIILGL